ncbi:carbohydrate ABC transporter permease [Paenibacillus nasutitermitis]|uniref:carbohydrate ABC transporter permease n=1 Tax=Paenibacillus nasutitermitis TaxID=1652958 RepID=UPI001E44DC9D|nr:carbohydrate ABC transporter permease [Paenibacillus nasutitermitis]
MYVLFFLVMALFPVAVVILNSFKNNIEINRITFLPEKLEFKNYFTILSKNDFYLSLFNSVFYVAASSAAAVFIVSLAGYSIARRGEKIFGLIYYFFLMSMMIPATSSLSALYTIVMKLDLVNTRSVMILLFTTGTIPMGILLFSGFIKSIPRALDESAIIDGFGYFRRYLYLILPLSKPVMIAFIVLTALGMWNNFFTGMLFLRDSAKFPLPLLVYAFSSKTQTDYGSIFALMCLSFIPPFLFFLLNQKHFYSGVAVGAVKG